jgi:hypothetical protein
MRVLIALCALVSLIGDNPATAQNAKPVAFTAFAPQADFALPPIVVQYDAATQSGANWAELGAPQWNENSAAANICRAANYLRDGLKRMTGREFPVVSSNDLSHGIVLTLLKNASPEIRGDAEIQKALQQNSQSVYSANEAFYLRSEKNRLLIVSNSAYGLTDAVAELLEAVDYEVLGMGPDWVYAPDYKDKPLVFSINRADHPSFLERDLYATGAQQIGNGTLMSGLTDPADETVDASYHRWKIGTRMYGQSLSDNTVLPYATHALTTYHRAVLEKMRETATTKGFLADIKVGLQEQRPAAAPEWKGFFWINSDAPGTPGYDKIAACDGAQWTESPLPQYFERPLDVSVPFVREIIFADMKRQAETEFKAHPDEPFLFVPEPEDGGVDDAERLRTLADKNWYPEYLAQEKMPFGRPYLLNGFKGLNQPKELWDASSASDHIYGLSTYLLHEFDKWIDSLPPEQRLTSTGKSKKQLVRCNLLSYNWHDVPPNFNPDPRLRVMVATFAKHRGSGKWEKIATKEDMAGALRVLLPLEPVGDYSILSSAFYHDGGPEGIPLSGWDTSSAGIADEYHRLYNAGFRAIRRETDLNFGKYGLGYYLASKVLWNASLTSKGLEAIRDRWFVRAFGSGWHEMKAYYDFMLPENYPVNSPNSWAKAIRFIDAADQKLDGAKEPDAQRRIDDVKQYWYAHYLMDSGKYTVNSPEVKEFLWKVQMSYMVSTFALAARDFNNQLDIKAIVGDKISAGPAHYTHEEMQAWWPKVLEYWKLTPVQVFADATLANGKPARTVDLNDLVPVKEFDSTPKDVPFRYQSGYYKNPTFLMVAAKKDDRIGFKLLWPYFAHHAYNDAKKVSYGVDMWNAERKSWEPWIDKSMTSAPSTEVLVRQGSSDVQWALNIQGVESKSLQVVDVQFKAPRPGVYRFSVGNGGNGALLTSPAYDIETGEYSARTGFTFVGELEGLNQSGTYIYIPKGTKSLDLDTWAKGTNLSVTLHKGLPAAGMTVSRKVDVSEPGTHTIALQNGEDGSLALLESIGINFPFLHSVPGLWAKSPAALLMPRGIAQADGLTIETSLTP